MNMRKLFLSLPAAALLGAVSLPARAAGAPNVDFAKQVQPILAENCYKCHGPEKQKGKLRLDTLEGFTKGGKDGKAFTAGAPEESPLYLRVVLPTGHDDLMPPEEGGGKPLGRD